jgi:hypothetical protein
MKTAERFGSGSMVETVVNVTAFAGLVLLIVGSRVRMRGLPK